jgi:hypothetical protein
MGCVDMDLIHLTQHNVHWWGAVNMALDLQVQWEAANFIS